MATIANSVMLIGIIGPIVIDQDEGIIAFTLTTNESIKQNDGSFEIETNEFDCIAQEPLATKMVKANLAGLKVACEGRLFSDTDISEKGVIRKWVFVEVQDFFKIDR